MDKNTIAAMLLRYFPYQPTHGQKELIHSLSSFISSFEHNHVFMLKGYAGTGKTTIVTALVNTLPALQKKSVLLAPTGRAAKVLASYSGRFASTIHRKLYRSYSRSDGSITLTLMENQHEETLFIVDEASMIHYDIVSNTSSLFSTRNLLEDLFTYVSAGKNCKLMLIGDTAQLPPVGLTVSPALDIEFLTSKYNIKIDHTELTEVVRQSEDSGILYNATLLRNLITSGKIALPWFSLGMQPDIRRINGMELEEELITSIDKFGPEESIVITRSNKRANIFNQEIRNRILFRDSEIAAGDMLMVVKNNYYWLEQKSRAGFIANGDMIEVLQLRKSYELYGFRFVDAVIRLVDYPDEKDIEVRLLLDTLQSNTAALSNEDSKTLFSEILEDYEDIPSYRQRVENVRNSPFFNALQVKFSYALTCHKTQGGQWRSVFIDQGYLSDNMMGQDYMRWLYTAVTRATERLFLVNFHDKFFE